MCNWTSLSSLRFFLPHSFVQQRQLFSSVRQHCQAFFAFVSVAKSRLRLAREGPDVTKTHSMIRRRFGLQPKYSTTAPPAVSDRRP